mmetsp:Transcript_17107/g.29593  ORF Transcript_17107/g.29593 Transcript_17107/m.29593 type:complete len:102 (-) Transcript_17107:233-538(-)
MQGRSKGHCGDMHVTSCGALTRFTCAWVGGCAGTMRRCHNHNQSTALCHPPTRALRSASSRQAGHKEGTKHVFSRARQLGSILPRVLATVWMALAAQAVWR